MSRQKLLQQVIGVTLVVLFLVGCGAPAATPEPPTSTPIPPTATSVPSTATPTPVPPTATPTPVPTPALLLKEGKWKGEGDPGFTISFIVDKGGGITIDGENDIAFHVPCSGYRHGDLGLYSGSTLTVRTKGDEIKFVFSAGEVLGKAVAPDRIEGTFHIDALDFTQAGFGECEEVNGVWAASPK